ncbi:MAG TPA: sulfatase-like hydrolase/transferase, partial [Candidatus Bathyarchaeia archaeon]|nr:sulfatase-like hydrolase/transferase [Candidatus Bathyarchaeia archaeon]
VGLSRGFSEYDDSVRVGDRRAFAHEERSARQTIDAVLASFPKLRSPFFLWVHLYDPHLPYVPPEPFASRFAGRPYDGEIAFMDAEIGRLLDALKRRTGSIVIAVAGDHGESLGEHGEEGHGVFLYQATQRVPMVLAGPGVPMGKTVATTVGLVDLAPTLLELAGQGPLAGADGRSLVPHLDGVRFPAADYELETFYPAYAYGWSELRALVSGPLKYIEAPRKELYELPTDPRETHDLAKVAARAARLRSLDDELQRRVGSDAPAPQLDDETEERRNRLASLGYVGGSHRASSSTAIDPKDGIVWLRELDTARRTAEAGDGAAAAAAIEKLLAKNPDNLQALFALVGVRASGKQWPQAVAAARRATALQPQSALARLHLANSLAGESSQRPAARAEALKTFDEAITLSPRFVETYLDATTYLLGSKDPEAARAMLERARAAGIADPTVETALGGLEHARGNKAAAQSAYERALVLDPGEAKALEGLGKIAFEAGQIPKAISFYERALDASPQARLAKTLGSLRLAVDDVPGAKAAFRRALELAPNDPDAKDLREMIDGIDK